MSPSPPGFDAFPDDEIVFRTLAAPGLEEDDLFAAMDAGRSGAVWGTGVPTVFASAVEDESPEVARRRRHEELLNRWQPRDDAW